MAFQIGSTARFGPRVTRLSTLLRRSFQSNMKRAAIQPEIPEPPVVIAETIPRQEESEECRSSEDETRIPLPEELGSHSQLISELLRNLINLKELSGDSQPSPGFNRSCWHSIHVLEAFTGILAL
ncbi:unnamed protein product [Rhodiola kirilowii]